MRDFRKGAVPLLFFLAGPVYTDDIGVSEFDGLYLSTFENSAFFPCQSEEIWWLVSDGSDGVFDALRPVRPESPVESYVHFVRVTGTVSGLRDSGFGHMGMYDQEIVISSVLESRLAEDSAYSACRGISEAEFRGHP